MTTLLFFYKEELILNLKRPQIKRTASGQVEMLGDRDFKYGYIHVSTHNLQDIFKVLNPNQIKMMFAMVKIIRQNSNMLYNLVNEPAENRDQILSAMGYIQSGSTAHNTLKKLFKEDIIKKVRSEKTFCGFGYYVNPYVLYYGKSVEDTTWEIFEDSKWKR